MIAVVREWKKRKPFENIQTIMNKFPSILTYITGRKNGSSVVKVFTKKDDKKAEAYLRKEASSSGILTEFVNVNQKVDKSDRPEKTNKSEIKPPSMDKLTRKRICKIINTTGEKLMALYSNINWIAVGNMPKGIHNGQPCIVLHCMDKVLVPFGEKQLPLTWGGYPVDIRESFVMLACSDGCTSLETGCSIGIPDKECAGSVGIFAKMRCSNEGEVSGFLTAAHVALDNHTELYGGNSFSTHNLNSSVHEITHPSLLESTQPRKIGKVKEAFYGEFNSTGIDAAFIETYQNTHGNYPESKQTHTQRYTCVRMCFVIIKYYTV